MKANLRALCLYVCIKTRSAAPSHGDEAALSCVPSHAIVTSRPALVQVPAKVRVVSTRSSSNSRRQCYWSQHHHVTGMKLLLLGQWLTRPVLCNFLHRLQLPGSPVHIPCKIYIYVGFIDNTPKGKLRWKEKETTKNQTTTI